MPISTEEEMFVCHVQVTVMGGSSHAFNKIKQLDRSLRFDNLQAALRFMAAEDGSNTLELSLHVPQINGRENANAPETSRRSIKDLARNSLSNKSLIEKNNTQKIRINIQDRRLLFGDKEVFLSPQLFAWYVWLAKRCLRVEKSQQFVRWTDSGIAEEFLWEYRRVIGSMTHHYERAVLLLASGMTQEFFQEKKSRVNQKIIEVLKEESLPFLIKPIGRRPTQKFGLLVRPCRIEIN
jgi:hypothetical protein